MFNLQGSEIIVILLLALVVLGPEKLPGAIRRFTRTYAELRKMGSSFQQEVKTAFDEPMREVRETAELIKQQVDVDELEVEQAERVERRDAVEPDAESTGAPEPVGDPFSPPVAGTARPGPVRLDLAEEPFDATVPPPPPARSAIPAPPLPFSSANGTPRPEPPRPEAETDAPDEESGAASP